MIVVVAPFLASIDPDAIDIALFAAKETARALDVPGIVVQRLADEVALADLPDAAAALGADAALGASLRIEEGALLVEAQLAGANVSASFAETLPLGNLPQLGAMLARAVLLALGEDAAAPAEMVAAALPDELALRLARGARQLEEGDSDELLAIASGEPPVLHARKLLFDWCEARLGTPEAHALLERIVEALPDEAPALLLFADSHALHLDEARARELYLAARDEAQDALTGARALSGLSSLAESAGRMDEAISQLRAAVRMMDDPLLHARLGELLLPRDAQEGLAALTRATVLAPDDAELLLRLSQALREHKEYPRALAAAAEAARLSEDDPALAARVRAELETILAEDQRTEQR